MATNDPLASLAKRAEKAVQHDDRAREADQEARASGEVARKRTARIVWWVCAVALVAGVGIYFGPRLFNPYYGEDPFADERRAKAYLSGLIDAISVWRAQHNGELPKSLADVVPESRLPPAASQYRVEYRVDVGTPVVALVGGPAPIIVWGPKQ